MIKVTMDEYLKQIEEKEAKMGELPFFTSKLERMAAECESIDKKKIVIKSDYDADGICSAYILYKTLSLLHPDKAITVKINDRRGSYGDIGGENLDDAQVFILDMGSNELDNIEKTYKKAFVIDHHITENVMRMQNNSRYINPKTFENGGDNCTTGLCFRLYEVLSDRAEDGHLLKAAATRNTLNAIAAVGTVADMVNLMDEYSFNRKIVKDGIKAINNASKDNFDQTVGFFLQNTCRDINGENGRDITANDISMSVAPFINGAGRMSELIEQNGSQEVFNALVNPSPLMIAKLNEYNSLRKAISKKAKTGDELTAYINDNIDGFKVNVFIAKDVPHSLCGIIAGNMAESMDAPAICLTYNEKSDTYSGSGRNAKNTESLKLWLDDAISGMDVAYGGHHDALGISKLRACDLDTFIQKIDDANYKSPITRTEDNIVVLDMKPSEIVSRKDEVVEFLGKIEPSYEKIYCVAQNEGRSKGAMKAGCPVWKKIIFKDGETKFSVMDWSFNEKKYDSTHSLCELGVDNFGDEGVSFTTCYRRQFNSHVLKNKELYKVEPPAPTKKASKKVEEKEQKSKGLFFNFGKR